MAHKKVTFEGWKNCLEVSSGNFKLVVATEIGPRILGAFFEDSDNLFYIYPKTAGRTGDKKWNNYGGHRLWHSPEEKPRTYTIENSKVDVRERGNSIVLHKGPDSLAGIEKTIEIIPFKNDFFKIIHTLRNWNRWEVELAAWAITVMAPGGTAIMPMPQGDKKALLPNTFISLWPYTDLSDGRIRIGSKYTLVKHNSKIRRPFAKIGFNCEDAWIAYQNKGIMFVKKYEHFVDAEYPDNGCSVECFSCGPMQEIETLSPFYQLGYKQEITHTEIWTALRLGKEILDEKDAELVFG